MDEAEALDISLSASAYAAVTPQRVRRDAGPRDVLAGQHWWGRVRWMRQEGLWQGCPSWAWALRWLQNAWQSRLPPDEKAYEEVLREIRVQNPESAARLLQSAAKMNLKPQASVFRSVIMSCCVLGLLHTAAGLVDIMVSSGYTPSSDIYRAICENQAKRNGDLEPWLAKLEDSEKELTPFVLMSCNRAMEGNAAAAQAWLQRACAARLELDVQCYSKVLAAHLRPSAEQA
ncbi:unnamed protein product, partial [Effrenium voratum]